jgi:acyl-CoA thioester hydrolase
MAAESRAIANSFSHQFCVPASDIDDLGHAGNVAWVRWVGDVAAAHSKSVGLDLAAYRSLGVLWVVRRHDIEYLRSALLGETIRATTWIDSVRGASSVRRTEFHRGEELLARATTTWVLVRTDSGRPTRVPTFLMQRFSVPIPGAPEPRA